MNKKYCRFGFLAAFILIFPLTLYAMAAKESAASNRGRYLTGLGYIYQPGEIQIDSLISKEDYDYPLPRGGPFNVTIDTDIKGNTGFIQIGLKAKKESFETLDPMNLCFVIDISGSMSERDKLSWVKNAFYIFINRVRPNDIVSVVVFDDRAEILFPPARIQDDNDRERFKRKVDTLQPRGNTDILQGMSLGYAQVEQNYRPEYTNRVLLLTDGMHNGSGTKDDILDRVKRYNQKNITISTIALGAAADINLMVDMAVNGGGSSRFISDYDKMAQTFGSELDRLVVPAARMLSIEIALSEGVRFQETWGYKNWVEGNRVHYSLDTLHNGDYETIFACVSFDRIPDAEETKLGSLAISYEEVNGAKRRNEAYDILLAADSARDLNSLGNRRIKKSEGFMVYGKKLIAIGELANSVVVLQRQYESSNSAAVKEQLLSGLSNGIAQIKSLSAYLGDINDSLGGNEYHDEFTTLENYEKSFADMYTAYTSPAAEGTLKP